MSVLAAALPAQVCGVVCADFSTQAEAQRYFEAEKLDYKRFDYDKDGLACFAN